jgi:hypothetical protein
VSEDTKKLLRRLLTKDPTRRIEWMELLKVNITTDGRLVGNKQERLSLVEEDGNAMEGAKLAESGSFPTKEDSVKSLSSSTQAYSPPSTQYPFPYIDMSPTLRRSFKTPSVAKAPPSLRKSPPMNRQQWQRTTLPHTVARIPGGTLPKSAKTKPPNTSSPISSDSSSKSTERPLGASTSQSSSSNPTIPMPSSSPSSSSKRQSRSWSTFATKSQACRSSANYWSV